MIDAWHSRDDFDVVSEAFEQIGESLADESGPTSYICRQILITDNLQ